MLWIKCGIEIPSKSEVIGRCGGDEKTEWPRRTDKNRTLKKKKKKRYLHHRDYQTTIDHHLQKVITISKSLINISRI